MATETHESNSDAPEEPATQALAKAGGDAGECVFRFAPSPNGLLHTGHAASALINASLAKRFGGRLLLRIEDIDIGRSREEFVDAIYEDLAWLGLTWEKPVLLQSRCMADYSAAARELADMGVLYPCFASRSEIAEAAVTSGDGIAPDGSRRYPGIFKGLDRREAERRIAAGDPHVMRLDMDRAIALAQARTGALTYREMNGEGGIEELAIHPERWGDVVLQRKDVPTSYHLSVVVDDARQGITHVVRGLDLQPATSIHRVLQILLGYPEPVYFHHALICDPVGRKLSKSSGDVGLRALREAGWLARDVAVKLGLELPIR